MDEKNGNKNYGFMPYLSMERCDEIFKDSCEAVATAVFLEKSSKNLRAAVLYILKNKVFVIFPSMTKL